MRESARVRGMNAIRFQFMCADRKITIIGINIQQQPSELKI